MTDVATTPAPPPNQPPPNQPEGDRPFGARALRIAVLVLLAFVWVRFVLFAWLFPLVERHVDNPEFSDTETSAPVDPAG